MKNFKAIHILLAILMSFNIMASEMTVKLRKSFFPRKDIVIDADSPDEIIVKYDLNYYISDGCATDIITTYQLGGCLVKKYKTYREENKYIVIIKDSSARKGKGPQTIRLEVKQKEKNSFDIIPVVTIIDGNEDEVSVKDSWFSKTRVTLSSRDEKINDSHLDEKSTPNVEHHSGSENHSNSNSQ